MKLPGAERAIVDSRKLREYILSPSHPVGRFKAAFFATLGYTLSNWKDFELALRTAAARDETELAELTPYGRKL